MISHYEAMYSACDTDVPCFAMELEQDIARLEAEADRDELVSFSFMEAPMEMSAGVRPLQKCLSDDVASMQDQTAHTSDADSDDGGEEDAQWAQVRENALMVSQSGKTLLPGAWRGCAKSAWCDREDRHRGLCNHRATIAGPAAMPAPAPASEQEESEDEQQGQDVCHLDDGVCEAAACGDVVMHAADEQQESGGHSHNCQAQDSGTHGDEREVDSAQPTVVCMEHTEGMQHQHSTSQVQLQAQVAAAAADAGPIRSTDSAEDELSQDLFWGGNAGQLAAAELFSIPAAYQPRVKDLTGPGAPCLLTVHSMSDEEEMSTPLAAPMAQPVEEQHMVPVAFESTCSDYSDHTNTKACTAVNSGSTSTPSSPSCASASAAAAELAAFGPFQPVVLTATPSADAAAPSAAATEEPQQQQQQHDASSPCTPESSTDFSMSACADADESAALAAAAAAAASACAEAEAAAAAAAAAVPVLTVAVGDARSAQAVFEQAAAEAVAAAAAAAAMATSCMSPTAGISPCVSPDGSPTAAMAAGLAGVQRPPRIKSKPSASLMKAAAVVEASSSPKSKKRPAARLASNPGGAHCCTSCGAVSTPVWRAGPAGPKTLCNACGVRYMKVAKRK